MASQLKQSYRQAREVCAWFHLPDWGVLQVQGPDARDFLQRLSTADLRPVAVGAATQTLFLKGDGRLVADAVAVCLPDDAYLLLTPPSCSAGLAELVERFHFSENLTVTDSAADYHVAMVAGPRRLDVLGALVADGSGIIAADCSIAPVSERLVVLAPSGESGDVRGSIDAAVASIGGVVGDMELFHVLRIEEGVPFYGVDTSDKTIPLEAGQKPAISFTKGCFPGQEIVARINNLGHPANVLVGLRLPADAGELVGRTLHVDGKEIGRITSSAWSPGLGGTLGLGYVKWNQREPGTVIGLSGDDNLVATVVALPLQGNAG